MGNRQKNQLKKTLMSKILREFSKNLNTGIQNQINCYLLLLVAGRIPWMLPWPLFSVLGQALDAQREGIKLVTLFFPISDEEMKKSQHALCQLTRGKSLEWSVKQICIINKQCANIIILNIRIKYTYMIICSAKTYSA